MRGIAVRYAPRSKDETIQQVDNLRQCHNTIITVMYTFKSVLCRLPYMLRSNERGGGNIYFYERFHGVCCGAEKKPSQTLM